MTSSRRAAEGHRRAVIDNECLLSSSRRAHVFDPNLIGYGLDETSYASDQCDDDPYTLSRAAAGR